MAIRKTALAFLGLLAAGSAAGAELTSYVFVRDDASLLLRGRTIHLHGVHVPSSERTCQRFRSPVYCASRAAAALDFKIGSRFVRCTPVQRNPDRSLSAVCTVDGEDLGAYLISSGLAVASPDAPFDYQVLERIARERELGIWGFSADSVLRRR